MKRIVRRCVVCTKLEGMSFNTPRTAPLSPSRVCDAPPFTQSPLDSPYDSTDYYYNKQFESMGLKVIIGSTSTPQIDSMCIPHRRNTTPTNIYASDGRQMFEHYHHSSYTADSQGGQEKPALQETWIGPRQTAASPQSFYITSSLEGW